MILGQGPFHNGFHHIPNTGSFWRSRHEVGVEHGVIKEDVRHRAEEEDREQEGELGSDRQAQRRHKVPLCSQKCYQTFRCADTDHDVVVMRPLAKFLKLPIILTPLFLELINGCPF